MAQTGSNLTGINKTNTEISCLPKHQLWINRLKLPTNLKKKYKQDSVYVFIQESQI